MKKSKIAQFILVILKLLFVLGIVSLIFVPYIYNLLLKQQELVFGNQSLLYKIVFYLCAITVLCIIYELIKIFSDIYKTSPFTKKIEFSLKRIAISFMVMAIIVGVKAIFMPTILSIVIAFFAFLVSLSFYVLSQIFKVAIEYKNEVDYTV